MPDEGKKPEGQPEQPPAGDGSANPPAPNQGPSAAELLKQKEELEQQIKDRDAKIADLETTKATIETRQRQLEEASKGKENSAALQERLSRINERRAYDAAGADKELAELLSEVKTQAAKDAVVEAQNIIHRETTLGKLRDGVRSANPDFDDDVVDVIMNRANQLATTGKYRTADEAVKAATEFVKSKFDGYAKKKNAVAPLPDGARAEGGGANNPPKPPEPAKEKTALDEIEEANAARAKRLL